MEFQAHDMLPEFTLKACVIKGCGGQLYAAYESECSNAVDYKAKCDMCGSEFAITIIDPEAA